MQEATTRLCVLCATMHQTDFSLAERMNLQCDAVLANQADREETAQTEYRGHRLQMLTTQSRGVGRNRNTALAAAENELFLFADDDVRYYDGYAEGVCSAFDELPSADVIIFGLDVTKNGEVVERRREKKRRLHLFNGLGAGSCRIAVRREAIRRQQLSFSEHFGGGCLYSHGEDSLFLADCYRSGLRVFACPLVLGQCAKDVSTCFSGYHERYFYDKGALVAAAFPRTKRLMKWVFYLKFRRCTQLPARVVLRRMQEGIRGYQKLRPYGEAPAMQAAHR